MTSISYRIKFDSVLGFQVKRSLSPDWNEQFSAVVDNLNPLFIQVIKNYSGYLPHYAGYTLDTHEHN